jgi:hypothetical protein
VEVQISFEGISLKGNRSKMVIILRAITVLDKTVHDVSKYAQPTIAPTHRFKRRQFMPGQKHNPKNYSDLQP